MSLKRQRKLDAEKAAKDLLLSREGRDALAKFGVNVEIADPKVEAGKPIVVILCPTYRTPEPLMTDALRAMVEYTREKGIAHVYAGPPLQSSVVHWSRNGLISEHLKSGKPWTHVLFIDDDIVVQPDHLEKLLRHKVDVVAGLCTRRQDPPMPNIKYLAENGTRFEQIFEWPDKPELLEVGAVGTGLMLLTQHALEQSAQIYFDCLWEKEFYGFSGQLCERLKQERLKYFDETKGAYWFRFLPTIDPPIEYGEDIGFCWLLKRYADMKIYADTSVQPGHLGSYPFGIRDFLPFQKEKMQEYEWKQMFAAATGRQVAGVRKVEQEKGESKKVSVLLPTRGRGTTLLQGCLDSLFQNSDGEVEILIRQDDDEPQFVTDSPNVRLFSGPRHGYKNLHLYYNELAEHATGDWLMVWNDDAVMETKGWDTKIHEHAGGLKVLNAGGELNLFPIFSRELYETLGHVSLQPHCDSWLQVISRMTGIEEKVDISIKHLREEIDDNTKRESLKTYKESSPDFFTPETFDKLKEDMEKVKAKLKANAQRPADAEVVAG